MTMRTYIRRWWLNDPTVYPCPTCGCPLQAPPRRRMADAVKAHFETVHPGLQVAAVDTSGAS